ncbi:hypothetical protein DFH06DRAFT_1148846 [Mycena polygramma]|nr:hypothetical protein DFH06DRAFT_1148846 [Mycena polygramma]
MARSKTAAARAAAALVDDAAVESDGRGGNAHGTLSDLSDLSDEDPGSMKEFVQTLRRQCGADATMADLEDHQSRAGSAPDDAQSSAATMEGSPPAADADVLPAMDVDQLPDDGAIAEPPAHRSQAAANQSSDDEAIPAATPSASPRKRKRRGHTAVNDSDEEDPAKLVPGDGMFAESSAVKSGVRNLIACTVLQLTPRPSLLPPAINTRSTARAAPPKKTDPTSSSDDVEVVSDVPPKKGPKSTGGQAGVRPTPKAIGKQRAVATPPAKPKAVATSPAKPKSVARPRAAASPAAKLNVSSAASPAAKTRVASARSVASPAANSSPASPSKIIAPRSTNAAPKANDPGVNNGLSPDMGRAVQSYLDAQSGTLAQSVLAQIMPALQETIGPIQAMMKAQQEAAAAAMMKAQQEAAATAAAAVAPAALAAAAAPAKATERAAKVASSSTAVASPASDSGLAPSPMTASPSRSGVVEPAMPIGDGFSTINTAKDDGGSKIRKKATIPGLTFAPAKAPPTEPVAPVASGSSEPLRASPGNSDAPLSDAWSTSDAGAPEPEPVPPPKSKLPALAGKMAPVKEERNDSKSAIGPNGMPTPGVYLEDLVKFKAKYDKDFPCQVADPELQDPMLEASYLHLPGLPGDCAVVPSFTRDDDEESTMKGGRLWFSVWPNVIKSCTELTITTAVLFTRSGIFINPCRASPAIVTIQPTNAKASAQRLNVDDRKVATCVTAGMCLQSHVATAVKTFGPAGREHKFLYLLFHNQDWERWEAFMCLCFGHKLLYASMAERAIQIGTRLSEPENGYNNRASPEKLPAGMTGGLKSLPGSPSKPKYPVKHALACDDIVPVYNALGKDIDFEDNLTAIFDLPKWEGEIPRKSLVVVGHTTTTYETQLGRKVLCGLPKPESEQ